MTASRARRSAAITGTLALVVPFAAAAAPAQTPSTNAKPTATTGTPAAAPAPQKKASKLKLRKVRRSVSAGRALTVRGRLTPAKAGRVVVLRARRRGAWTTLDRARTTKGGSFRLRTRTARPGTLKTRVVFTGDRGATASRRTIGSVHVFRRAFASWYGPGLYGNHLGCGGRLTRGTIGVAHKSLPCGTKLVLRHGSRIVRARVIDRGPYVGGREFDLTAATKQRLGFGSTGFIGSTR